MLGAKLLLAAVAATTQSSHSFFTVPTNEVSWRGSPDGRATSWCRLFTGDRFHVAGGMHSSTARHNVLSPPEKLMSSGGGLVVPAMSLKDLISMTEHTRIHATQNGSITERVCELTCRKITTAPVKLDMFKGYNGLFDGPARFFLDKRNGRWTAEQGLGTVVNHDNYNEIVMGINELEKLFAFLLDLNSSGGYGVCEVSRLSEHWYGVRRIIVIGREVNGPQPVQHFSASITAYMRQGKRYISEYHGARLVGASGTRDMVAAYHAPAIVPPTDTSIVPVSWVSANSSGASTWLIQAVQNSYTVQDSGRIRKTVEDVLRPVRRPLHGYTLLLEQRASKTNCRALVECGQAGALPGYASSLSLLWGHGAGSGRHPLAGREQPSRIRPR